MAILKTKTLTNGATGCYWKITSVQFDAAALTLSWTLMLFADAAHAKDHPSDPIGCAKYFSRAINREQKVADLLKLAYTLTLAEEDSDLAGGSSV